MSASFSHLLLVFVTLTFNFRCHPPIVIPITQENAFALQLSHVVQRMLSFPLCALPPGTVFFYFFSNRKSLSHLQKKSISSTTTHRSGKNEYGRVRYTCMILFNLN